MLRWKGRTDMYRADEAQRIVNEVAQDRRAKMHDILQRTLKIIATEMYGHDVHFVLELIQNAEDNEYDNRAGAPFIRFRLESDRIIVENNERGFDRSNLESLCDVGQSTKRARTLGYVGEKGIGFKSVFKISPGPMVFSGGFQIQLNDQDYIIPRWVTPPAGIEVSKGTSIVLPLKPDFQGADGKLARQVSEIDPMTILFLRKLARIEVTEDRKPPLIIRRDGGIEGRVNVTAGPVLHRWWLHRRELEVPSDLHEEKRKDVRRRELIVGFRLDKEGHCRPAVDSRLYAFLPTEVRPGFPIVLQGDFLLTANREALLADNAWNVWLRNEVAATVVEAVRFGVRERKFALSCLPCIPLPSPVQHAFFQQASREVLKRLPEESVFPTVSGGLRPAAEVIQASKTIQQLFPNAALATLLGRPVEYLDPDCAAPADTLRALGIASADERFIGEVLGNEPWLRSQNDDWFINLYGFLHDHPHLVPGDLKKLHIVRLQSGELAASANGVIYLPAREERVGDSYGLDRFRLRVVRQELIRRDPHPQSQTAREANERSQKAREFLIRELNVQYHRAIEITLNSVLPYLSARNWQQVTLAELKADFGLLLYIKEQWPEIAEAASASDTPIDLSVLSKRLGQLFPVPVTYGDGRAGICPAADCYLPKSLGGDERVEALLKGIAKAAFARGSYVEWDPARRQQDRKRQEWAEFLAAVGVNRNLRLCPVVHDVTVARPFPLEWPRELSEVRVTRIDGDVDCPELGDLLERIEPIPERSTSDRTHRATLLLQHLDEKWEALCAGAGRGDENLIAAWWYRERRPGRQTDHVQRTPSKFLQRLRNASWVPTVHGDFARPTDVWLRSSQSEISGGPGKVLAVGVESQALIEALGFRTEASLAEITQALKGLVQENRQDLGSFRRLFQHLGRLVQSGAVSAESLKRLAFERIIYVPDRARPFATAREVVWEMPISVWAKGFPAIAPHYPELQALFTAIGVEMKATPQQAIDVLRRLEGTVKPGRVEAEELDQIFEAYHVLVTLANASASALVARIVIQRFLESGQLFCRFHRFRPARQVYLADDRRVAELFGQDIDCLWLPDGTSRDFARQVADVLELRRTSEVARTVTVIPGMLSQSEIDLIDGCRRGLVGYIRQEHQERFLALASGELLGSLAAAPLVPVRRLTVTYRLGDLEAEDTKNVHAILEPSRVLVLADSQPDLDQVCEGIQRALGGVPGLADVFGLLLSKSQRDREALLRRRNYLVPDEEWQRLLAGVTKLRPELPQEPAPKVSAPPPLRAEPAHPVLAPAGGAGPAVQTQSGIGLPDKPPLGAPEAPSPGTKGRPFEGTERWSVPRGRNTALRTRLGARFPGRREVDDYLEGTEGGIDAACEPAMSDEAGVVHTAGTTLRAVNLQEAFLRFHPTALPLFDLAKRPDEVFLVGEDEQRPVLAYIDYERSIIHGGRDEKTKSEFRALLEEDALPPGAKLQLDATDDPGVFHIHGVRLEQPQVLTDVSWWDFDESGRPTTRTSERVSLEYAVHEPTYRAERRFEQRQAYESIIQQRAVGVLQDIYEMLESLDQTPATGLSPAEIHRRLLASDHPCAYYTVLGVLYGYRCFVQVNDGLWTLDSQGGRVLKPGYDETEHPCVESAQPSVVNPPTEAVDAVDRRERVDEAGKKHTPNRPPVEPHTPSGERNPDGLDQQQQHELDEIVNLLRGGSMDQWLRAARRLATFAARLVEVLEHRISATAPEGQSRKPLQTTPDPAPADPKPKAPDRDGKASRLLARAALTEADEHQRSDLKLALSTAIVAWHRAHATGSRRLVADAAMFLGRSLLNCNASVLAALYLRHSLDNGGEVSLAELVIARQAGSASAEPSVEQSIRSIAGEGRRLLLQRSATREWPELNGTAWAALVEDVIRHAGISPSQE